MNLNEVTQRRLEKYQEKLLELNETVKSAAAFNRILIEAAVYGGIADGVPDDLGDLTPRKVRDMSERIASHVKAALEPLPGES